MTTKTFLIVMVTLFLLSLSAGAQDPATRTYTKADFITVEGTSLADKIDRAVRQFKSARQGDTLWVAYDFPARSGVHISPMSGFVYHDDDGIRLTRQENLDGAAVFLLVDARGNSPVFTRVKTLNLNEPYLFENRPVYWLGNVDAAQSLAQLESVRQANQDVKVIVRGVLRAISQHDSPRAIPLLKEIALKDANLEIQRSAVSSLARVPNRESLDALDEIFTAANSVALKQEVVRSYTHNAGLVSEKRVLDKLTTIAKSGEDLEIRKEAIRRIAGFRGDAIVERLFEIYQSLSDREAKAEILRRVSVREGKDDPILRRLVAVAKREIDAGLQREAVRRIATSHSDESVEALIEIYDGTAADTVKEEIISRLAQSQSRKAFDKLVTIAKNDASPRLRQAAIRRVSTNRNFQLLQ